MGRNSVMPSMMPRVIVLIVSATCCSLEYVKKAR
jgi:hypothetical protein